MKGRIVARSVRALALDVDGTVADTDPIHADAWLKALKSVNGKQFNIDEYLYSCINGAMTPQKFLAAYSSGDEWASIELEKRRLYPHMILHRGILRDGLVELLDDAASKGLQIAIVSSSSRESVNALLANLWKNNAPEVIIARDDAPSPKPAPAPYLAAIEQLGVPARSVVAFEDSESGISSAEDAGLTCIQIGNRGPEHFARQRINNFRECSIVRNANSFCLLVQV